MALELGWETEKHEEAQQNRKKKKKLPAKAKNVAVINLAYLILSYTERSGA